MELTLGEIKTLFNVRNDHLPDDFLVKNMNRDSRSIQPGEVYVAIKGERFDGHDFVSQAIEKGASAVLIDRDMDCEKAILVSDVVRAMGELAHFYRSKFGQPIIAITGSSGKTTTKELLTHVLSQFGKVVATQGNLNNHIGVPVTVFRFDSDSDFFIVEMGMSALEEIRYLAKMVQPNIGVVTSVGRAHLENLGNIENIAKAKSELFAELSSKDKAFVFVDDPWISKMPTKAKKITYSFTKGDYVASDITWDGQATQFKISAENKIFPVSLSLSGTHHVQNALSVFAIADRLGLSKDLVVKALASFSIDMNRGQVLDKGPLKIIDDSYNANPDSMKVALESLVQAHQKSYKIAVLGDMLELGGQAEECHLEIGEFCRSLGVDALLSCGEYGPTYIKGFGLATGQFFENHKDLAMHLRSMGSKEKSIVILLKGSRGSQMEKVLEYLEG